MTLLHPWWLLPALLCVIAYFLIDSNTRNDWRQVINKVVLRFLNSASVQSRSGKWSGRHPGFLYAAIAFLALSGPSIQSTDSQSFKHSQGWIVLADVSRSMTLEDIAPSRLSAMRDTALGLAERANTNSTTLIVYAGDAFIVAPPSFDTNNFNSTVSLLEYGVVPVDGSNVTRAFALALSVLESTGVAGSRLFVLSDTGGFNTNANAAVARLAQLGHQTDFILYGSDETSSETSFDLDIAQSMAESGGGQIVIADAIGGVNFTTLDLQSQSIDRELLTQSGITTLQWRNQSHWILLLGIPLLLLLFRRGYL